MSVAAQLKKSRAAAKLTIAAAANRAGLSPKSLYAYEQGTRRPSLEALEALAPALKTTVSKLTAGL